MAQAKWTEEMVLEGIRQRHRYGRTINFSAVVTDDEPLSGAARRIFGSWGNAISVAGLEANQLTSRSTWAFSVITGKMPVSR